MNIKRIVLVAVILAFAATTSVAQVGKTITALTITDPDNQPKAIPFVGEKVLMILYTDPDVKDVNDQLSEAVRAKHFDASKYAGMGIANTKESWIPNSAIRMKARQKEKQFAGSIVMLDQNSTLANAWKLGDCNSVGMVLIIGKDKVVKFAQKVTTEVESKAIIAEVLKILEAEISK